MYKDDDFSVLKVFLVILIIFWCMFEFSTCMEYKDTPAGEVPKWVDWVL